jgi:tRNA U34 5-methylaminomethyl-2-thiouridine-forming methyltransferase MnmC
MVQVIKITEDGSCTLFVPSLNEHYHSTYGAVQESMHVFINSGLHHIGIENPKILEIGFGTGLNALLTLLEAYRFQSITYDGLELNPLNWDTVGQLGYSGFLKLTNEDQKKFQAMHDLPWDRPILLQTGFTLNKIHAAIEEFEINNNYDLVYFDAFAPEIQPELWVEPVFQKIYNVLNKNGILVTYCAKGEVRRIMQRCGFEVERLPGPPGKREMLSASKK